MALAVVYAMLGPTVCYALARVLRPYHQPDGDRIVRHPLAAAGTAYGLPLIVAQYLDDGWESYFVATYGPAGLGDVSGFDAFFVASTCLGLGAAALGITTVAWGLVALIVRASVLRGTVTAHRRRLPR